MQQQRPTASQVNSQLVKCERTMDQCIQSSQAFQCPVKQEAEQQQRVDCFPHLQQISHNLATDLYNVSDSQLTAPPSGHSLYYTVYTLLKYSSGFCRSLQGCWLINAEVEEALKQVSEVPRGCWSSVCYFCLVSDLHESAQPPPSGP